jgi:hypothetical protein
VVIALFALLAVCTLGFAAWELRSVRLAAAQEALRLSILAESAFAHLKAASLEEKIRAESLKKSYDLNLERLKDSLAKGRELNNPKEEPPKTFVTVDGREITSEDYDIV